jgi:hypothetical protein
MDLVHWIVFGVVPAVAAVLAGVGTLGPRWLALALALAVCVPFGMAAGWPRWPWQLPWQGAPLGWLWWAFAGAGVVGAAYDRRLLPRLLLLVAEVVLVVALPWLVAGEARGAWRFELQVLWLAGAWLLLGSAWWVLRRVARVLPGLVVPLGGTIALATAAWVLRAHGVSLHWQLAGVAAVGLLMAVATTTWQRPFRCGTGAALAIAVLHAGPLLTAHAAGQLASRPFVLAAVVPLPLGLALARPFARRHRLGAACGLGGSLLLAAAAIVWT